MAIELVLSAMLLEPGVDENVVVEGGWSVRFSGFN